MVKKNRGFTLVEIMVTILIVAFLAIIAIPNILRVRIHAHESFAKASLKAVSTALESYLTIHSTYPSNISALTGAAPPYLQKNYFDGNVYNGFTFTINTLTGQVYTMTAAPANANLGSTSFTISTGSVLVEN